MKNIGQKISTAFENRRLVIGVAIVCAAIIVGIGFVGVVLSSKSSSNGARAKDTVITDNADETGAIDYATPESTRSLSAFVCGAPDYTFGENAAELCKIRTNGKTGEKPFDDPTNSGNDFPAELQNIKSTAAAVLTPGTGETLDIHKTAQIQFLQYAYTSKDLTQGTVMDQPKWQMIQDTWAQPVENLTFPITKSTDDGSMESKIGYLLNGNKVGTIFAVDLIDDTPPAEGEQTTPPILLIAAVTEIVKKDSTNSADVSALPTPSTDLPANAPSLEFDGANKPVKLDIPSGFNLDNGDFYVKTITEGNGDVIRANDTAVINYTVWTADGVQQDSSYEYGRSVPVDLANSMSGLAGGIHGQRVGSKVLIMIPGKYGFEDIHGNGKPTANVPLYYYVDIVGLQ